jgi:hypothetical protein
MVSVQAVQVDRFGKNGGKGRVNPSWMSSFVDQYPAFVGKDRVHMETQRALFRENRALCFRMLTDQGSCSERMLFGVVLPTFTRI